MKTSTDTRFTFELTPPGGVNFKITKIAQNEKEAAKIVISEFKFCIEELEKLLQNNVE